MALWAELFKMKLRVEATEMLLEKLLVKDINSIVCEFCSLNIL